MKKIFTLFLGIAIAFSSYASHLMGGQISATYLSSDITGSHYIYDSTVGKFVKVENYSGAKITKKKSKILSCLITSTHKIPVGEHTFWDWEDDKIPK